MCFSVFFCVFLRCVSVFLFSVRQILVRGRLLCVLVAESLFWAQIGCRLFLKRSAYSRGDCGVEYTVLIFTSESRGPALSSERIPGFILEAEAQFLFLIGACASVNVLISPLRLYLSV